LTITVKCWLASTPSLRQPAIEHALDETEMQERSDATAATVITSFKARPHWLGPYYAAESSSRNHCWRNLGDSDKLRIGRPGQRSATGILRHRRLAQTCAVWSPFPRSITVIGMFRQQPEARSHTVNSP